MTSEILPSASAIQPAVPITTSPDKFQTQVAQAAVSAREAAQSHGNNNLADPNISHNKTAAIAPKSRPYFVMAI